MLNIEKLKFLRKSREMSQGAVADAIGVTRFTITLYETGKRSPTAENACKLARLFGVRVEELFT